MALFTIPALIDDRYLLEQFPSIDYDVHHGFMQIPATKSKYDTLHQYAQVVASEPGSNQFQQLAAFILSLKASYAARIQREWQTLATLTPDDTLLKGGSLITNMERLNEIFDDAYHILMAAEKEGVMPDFTVAQYGSSEGIMNSLYTGFKRYRQL